ncbi:MAG TPA: apolipoprotein N-acyltransferase [Candidatus Limnocylindrales bacterium]|nr:apolipoprotein N-acyltransferase [Candidatus Limnocylindrales bacterium]
MRTGARPRIARIGRYALTSLLSRSPLLAAAGAIVFAAACFGLASFSTVQAMPLCWIALVPFLLLLERVQTLRGALLAGWAMSVAFVLAIFEWFATAISTYSGSHPAVSMLLLLAAAPVLQPQFLTFSAARWWMHASGAPPVATMIVGACAYVGTEYAFPKLLGDTLGLGFYPSRALRQLADIGGPGILTFVVVILNELARAAAVPETWRTQRRRALVAAIAAVAILAGMTGYGRVRLARIAAAEAGREPVTAALVQANIANYERLRAQVGSYEAVRAILNTHFGLSYAGLKNADVDLVVWPETAYPTTFGAPKSEAGKEFDTELRVFATSMKRAFVFGSYDLEGEREYNAAIFVDAADVGSTRSYRKTYLFPLTERVPWWLEWRWVREQVPWLGTWEGGAGPKVVPLKLPDGRQIQVTPMICFDAIEPKVAAHGARSGAELLLTISNDGWFEGGRGAWLHLLVASFRSIETHLPQLRGTNTGVTAAIDATGELLAVAEVNRPQTLVATVTPVVPVPTLAAAWGQWFGLASLLAGAAVAVTSRVRSPR